MYIAVGLGNPGAQYELTRHNIGHMVIGELVRRAGANLTLQRPTSTRNASVRLGLAPGCVGVSVLYAVTTSFMNISGGPVKSLLSYFSEKPENLLVIHDDLDLAFGRLRLKRGGGSGGHNGLKSITQSLGEKNYMRLRFGIGRPPGRQDPADYVLGKFSRAEQAELDLLISEAADAVEDVFRNGLEAAQLRLHTAQ